MNTVTHIAAASRQGTIRNSVWMPWVVLFVLFAPPGIRFLLGTSSNTAGLVLVCTVVCGLAIVNGQFVKGGFGRWAIGGAAATILVLMFHLTIAIYLPRVPQVFDAARTGASLLSYIVCAVTAGVIADWLIKAPPHEIDRIGVIVRWLLVGIGLWCFIGYQPPSPLDPPRPAFPFTEPSHFALTAAPFVIDGCLRQTLWKRIGWLLVWLGIGFINQSLSLMVATSIAAVVCLPIAYALTGVAIAAIVAAGLDLQYYADRLDLSENSSNLSSLVYQQGWELLREGFTYSRGWGIGFQQLGFAPLNVPTSDIIYRILSDDTNLRDGSFLAAKLISEFGVFGVALIAAFMVVAVRWALYLRVMVREPRRAQDANVRFAASMVCAFMTEMFIRDLGYFSGTVVLLAACLMALPELRRRGTVQA